MTVLEKKFKLVLKTTHKKLFLKYQDNARFPSLCLVSENAIFGSRRRRRKQTKKKTQQTHRGSRQRTGCPNYDSLERPLP